MSTRRRTATQSFGLRGRVVTMDAQHTVHQDARVYVTAGRIAAVVPANTQPPLALADAPVRAVSGTIVPGLIELHNHIPYNVIGLWSPPKKYKNRDEWRGAEGYDRDLKAPMDVVTGIPELTGSVARWVECKALVSGVTATQGIGLMKDPTVQRYLHGLVRNVEATGSKDLPSAGTSVADVEKGGAAVFLAKLKKKLCLLLHLSEGTDDVAHGYFENLKLPSGDWAVTRSLAGIHSTALRRKDFDVLAKAEASVVWSPLSNLVLYGATTKVKAAKASGVRFGLGADWSFTGSKNLLGELKVARVVSAAAGAGFKNEELVQMVTSGAAAILGWDKSVGSIEAGKRADLVVFDGWKKDPYQTVVDAMETDIRLVLIDGVPRFGLPSLMKAFGGEGESFKIGGRQREFNLSDAASDEVIAGISLDEARTTLTNALASLPQLATAMGRPQVTRRSALAALGVSAATRQRSAAAGGWRIILDEFEGGASTAAALRTAVPAFLTRPLEARVATRIRLDPLTVADDPRYLDQLTTQPNLPAGLGGVIAKEFK